MDTLILMDTLLLMEWQGGHTLTNGTGGGDLKLLHYPPTPVEAFRA